MNRKDITICLSFYKTVSKVHSYKVTSFTQTIPVTIGVTSLWVNIKHWWHHLTLPSFSEVLPGRSVNLILPITDFVCSKINCFKFCFTTFTTILLVVNGNQNGTKSCHLIYSWVGRTETPTLLQQTSVEVYWCCLAQHTPVLPQYAAPFYQTRQQEQGPFIDTLVTLSLQGHLRWNILQTSQLISTYFNIMNQPTLWSRRLYTLQPVFFDQTNLFENWGSSSSHVPVYLGQRSPHRCKVGPS